MSRPADRLLQRPGGDELVALARAGLAEFLAGRLPEQAALAASLRREAADLLGTGELPDWPVQLRSMESGWPPTGDPLAALAAELRLSLAETLTLCLAGDAQASHATVMALAALQAPDGPAQPTVHLAVALADALLGPGRLETLACQDMAVVRHGLVELAGDGPLPLRALSIHPALWATLRGRTAPWPGCRALSDADAVLLPDALRQALPRAAEALAGGGVRGVVLRGRGTEAAQVAAAALARAMGRRALAVPTELWRETPALSAACRYGGWLPVLAPDLGPGETWLPGEARLPVPFVAVLGSDGAVDQDGVLELAVPVPEPAERRQHWQRHWGETGALEELAAGARLDGHGITRVARYAEASARHAGRAPGREHIAEARRRLAADRLRLLAHPVPASVTEDALVVPPLVAEALDDLVRRARRRDSLHRHLGITLAATGHPGLRALFAGASGTGKTLAASYVATRLHAPLYRVDLAAVMNKYIGESEKNLGRLLDAAAADDVVLLFDEADALFGRRGEAKHAGERYANNLTNFLLTRIEQHPGVVILTSNARERIDEAFTRRLDQVVDFPQPGYRERLRLWRSHLGDRAPDDEALRHLASHCELAGGHLRVAVLDAAASVADGAPVPLPALVRALAVQYRKLGRGLPPALERLAEDPA